MIKGLFRLDASAPIWQRKIRRAGFGTHVSQSEHSHRPRRIIIFIQSTRRRYDVGASSLNRPLRCWSHHLHNKSGSVIAKRGTIAFPLPIEILLPDATKILRVTYKRFNMYSCKGLFRPDAPTSNWWRLYCITFLMRRGRSECSDWLTCVPNPARCVLRRHCDADASGLNRP